LSPLDAARQRLALALLLHTRLGTGATVRPPQH
jgi:hypothetical protein